MYKCIFYKNKCLTVTQLLNDDDLSDPSTEFNDDLKNSDNLNEP